MTEITGRPWRVIHPVTGAVYRTFTTRASAERWRDKHADPRWQIKRKGKRE